MHSEKILNDIGCWIPSSDCAILDYGCGEALYATGLLAKCSHLTLVDTSQNTRTQIKSRLNNSDNVKILSPEDCASLKNDSIDLIVANSVFQYLNQDQTLFTIQLFHRVLKHDGKVIIADIIPLNSSVLSDSFNLLKLGYRNQFFLASIFGLFKTFFSDYRILRNSLGLTNYSSDDLIYFLTQNGFKGKLEVKNFGHNKNRLCFSAKKINKNN